eukprot:TRINITY_DN10172_c0_g1_i1.p1 TRINITY_DN10172_c0_g1~~TRINITY_DN10172_c0_g1_i1.p1  ORF type:complete len:224 (+),score=20.48 TRINITY_DN10172_c0_g1_i1:26-673(+)
MQIVFHSNVFGAPRRGLQIAPLFDLLPSEIILQITTDLAWRELLSLEMCSKRLKQILEFFDDKLWKKHFIVLRNNLRTYANNRTIDYSVPFGQSYKISFVLEMMEQRLDKSILDQTLKMLTEGGIKSAYEISFYRPSIRIPDTKSITAQAVVEYFNEICHAKRAVLSTLVDRWLLLWTHSAYPNKPQYRAGINKEVTVVSDEHRTLAIQSVYEID